MRLVKVGLASVNTTVGAHRANVDRALFLAKDMAKEGVTVGVFQEQLVGGYPSEDLVQWQGFMEGQWAELGRFARETRQEPTVFVLGVAIVHQGLRYNCAAVVAGGAVVGLVPKEKLPMYGVFYEGRNFARGHAGMSETVSGVPLGDFLFDFDFGVLAAEVCEDLWSPDGPMGRRAYSGAELVVNVSASPFRLGVLETRRELVASRASDHQCTVAYANAVGANDGLIFDGGGFVNQNGKWVLEAARFREGFSTAVVDLDRTLRLRSENTTWRVDQRAHAEQGDRVARIAAPDSFRTRRDSLAFPVPPGRSFFVPAPSPLPSPREQLCEDVLDALALGVGDYFEKNKAFKVMGVALSGGRDSMLTLLIAHRYAVRARPQAPGSLLKAFYLASRYSTPETRDAAETICRELGVPFEVHSIDEAFERELAAVAGMLGGTPPSPITEQNIQARIRGARMWSWANSAGGLFLQTGNMSEKAVGYTTVGGDLMGALAVIANVPKTLVVVLLEHLFARHHYEGIRKATARPAGPELALGQRGEDELMPFPVLDACFHLFAGEKLLPSEVVLALTAMFPEIAQKELEAHVEKFASLFLKSIFKWVQAPLSLHIGYLDLERERALQLPVVQRPDWTRP